MYIKAAGYWDSDKRLLKRNGNIVSIIKRLVAESPIEEKRMTEYESVYIKTHREGRLREKIEQARRIIADCTMCPRMCHVDRLSGETGFCKTGEKAVVSSYNPHYGEESPLVGKHGSGTIFFTYCNMLCIFCQNYDISHEGYGRETADADIARIMLHLQRSGCHNINFVTPSHVIYPILSALEIAVEEGLKVPLVYNTGGYDTVETLKLLDGVVDIYMPDVKFFDADFSEKVCGANDYPDIVRNALKEMHRQTGDLEIDDKGIARRGLLVRHLVLPQDRADTRDVMRFIAREISKDTYVNIMPQYRPCGRAGEIKDLASSPSASDFNAAFEAAKEEGIWRFDTRRRVFIIG